MLAVKKLMPESLLNYRFRGTTMSFGELIVALENIIIDKVATVPTARGQKHDTSAPMEIGMAAKEDSENVIQEGDQRIIDLAPQRNWQRKVELWQGSKLERKEWQGRRQRIMAER